MRVTKRQLKRIIKEERARLRRSRRDTPGRARLRKLIREQGEPGGGAPNVDDIARKLSGLGAEGALGWIGDLLAKLDVGAGPEPAAAPPPPPVEEPLPGDM